MNYEKTGFLRSNQQTDSIWWYYDNGNGSYFRLDDDENMKCKYISWEHL